MTSHSLALVQANVSPNFSIYYLNSLLKAKPLYTAIKVMVCFYALRDFGATKLIIVYLLFLIVSLNTFV